MSATKKNPDTGLKREARPAVIAAAIAVVLCGVGAGAFYVVNNGWKTQGQKDYSYYHEYLPIVQLHHGDRKAFDEENALRKKEGQPPLVDNKDKLTSAQIETAAQRIQQLKAYQAAHPQGAGH